MVLFDSITGAIYGPNTNGVTEYVARAIAPEVSYQIGQYFKGNDYLNGLDNGSRNGEGSAPHILAHGILAAAVSYATGSDPTTGALSAMGAEAAAKPLAQYLFGTSDTSKLTAEQKATVSSITSLAGLGIGASTGNVGSAVNAGETSKVAVEDNYLNAITDNSLLKKDITYQSFNNEIIKCKNSSNGCTDELKKYWSEHQANFNKLKAECADGGLVCPSWEE